MFLSYPLLYVYNVGLVSCKFSIFHYKSDFSILVEFLLLFSAPFPGLLYLLFYMVPKQTSNNQDETYSTQLISTQRASMDAGVKTPCCCIGE